MAKYRIAEISKDVYCIEKRDGWFRPWLPVAGTKTHKWSDARERLELYRNPYPRHYYVPDYYD